MENYSRELRIEADIRKKEKIEKAIEFIERIKKVYEKVGVAVKKTQEDIKRQVDRERKEIEN